MALSALPSKDVDQYSEEDKLNDSHLTTLKKQELKKELNTNNQVNTFFNLIFNFNVLYLINHIIEHIF